jgi:hypothetical protein
MYRSLLQENIFTPKLILMKSPYRASLAFKLQKPAAKAIFGANVINALSELVPADKHEDTNFPDLPVSLSKLQIINNELSAVIEAVLNDNTDVEIAVKIAVIQWNAAFTLTANYINSIAAGNDSLIRRTGFVPVKDENTSAQKPALIRSIKQPVMARKAL